MFASSSSIGDDDDAMRQATDAAEFNKQVKAAFANICEKLQSLKPATVTGR